MSAIPKRVRFAGAANMDDSSESEDTGRDGRERLRSEEESDEDSEDEESEDEESEDGRGASLTTGAYGVEADDLEPGSLVTYDPAAFVGPYNESSGRRQNTRRTLPVQRWISAQSGAVAERETLRNCLEDFFFSSDPNLVRSYVEGFVRLCDAKPSGSVSCMALEEIRRLPSLPTEKAYPSVNENTTVPTTTVAGEASEGDRVLLARIASEEAEQIQKEIHQENLMTQRAFWLAGLTREPAMQKYVCDQSGPRAIHPSVCNEFLKAIYGLTEQWFQRGMFRTSDYVNEAMRVYIEL